jgi:hypothetical protein
LGLIQQLPSRVLIVAEGRKKENQPHTKFRNRFVFCQNPGKRGKRGGTQ